MEKEKKTYTIKLYLMLILWALISFGILCYSVCRESYITPEIKIIQMEADKLDKAPLPARY